jgi:hypothetical protein
MSFLRSLKEDGQMRQADKQAVRQLRHNRQKINLMKTIGQKINTHFNVCVHQENGEGNYGYLMYQLN